ncbi:hypothetical protein V2O64_13240 [Verrucomicrobiaceae bacterium 227]
MEHRFFETGDPFDVKIDGGEVVFEDAIVSGIGQGKVTKVAFVGFGPVGLAVVVVTQAAQEGEEPGLGAAKVIDGIGAGTAKEF